MAREEEGEDTPAQKRHRTGDPGPEVTGPEPTAQEPTKPKPSKPEPEKQQSLLPAGEPIAFSPLQTGLAPKEVQPGLAPNQALAAEPAPASATEETATAALKDAGQLPRHGGGGGSHGDIVVCQFKKAAVVIGSAGGLLLRSQKGEQIGNRKILRKVTGGSAKEANEKASGGFIFAFGSSNSSVIDTDDAGRPTTIGALIKASGADKLFAHGSFPKGAPPPKFVRKKSFAFVPSDPSGTDARALEAARSASKIRPMWVVGVSEGKLIPKGVALVTTTAIPATAGDIEL